MDFKRLSQPLKAPFWSFPGLSKSLRDSHDLYKHSHAGYCKHLGTLQSILNAQSRDSRRSLYLTRTRAASKTVINWTLQATYGLKRQCHSFYNTLMDCTRRGLKMHMHGRGLQFFTFFGISSSSFYYAPSHRTSSVCKG
jgi:hypothetical protein